MTLEEILKQDEKFRYQLLGRMQADCEYFLNCGASGSGKTTLAKYLE